MSAATLAQQPPRAAAGVRPRGGQRVLVPWRLVVGAQYPDVALSTYVKVSALAQRAEGCTARVERIAEYLGTSKSSVERGLRTLRRPDPVDGIIEVPTVRRTMPGGTGESALRTVRALDRGEDFVWLPVRAAEALTPRQLRAYAILAYAEARKIPLSVGDLAEMLHHQSGARAGEHLDERTARRLVDDLDASGWITIGRREGHQGRHVYTVHRSPLHGVLAASAPVGPDTDDGSGPDLDDGSLASKEDHSTDRPEQSGVGGAIRRRRGDRSRAVDNPGSNVPASPGPDSRALRADDQTAPIAPPPASGYTGPALQLSPRVWHVLDPVRHLLPAVRPYVLRQVGREIGRQLDAGTAPGRLRDRIAFRHGTNVQALRDPGRWLLGVALPRYGCGLHDCESGVLWTTGTSCQVCADLRAAQRAPVRPATPAPALPNPPPAPDPRRAPTSWCACPDCTPPAARYA